MVSFHFSYAIVSLNRNLFERYGHLSSLLPEFHQTELSSCIGNDPVWGSLVYINPAKAYGFPNVPCCNVLEKSGCVKRCSCIHDVKGRSIALEVHYVDHDLMVKL